MIAREWRHLGPLSSREMDTQRNQVPEDDMKSSSTLGGKQDIEARRYLKWANPQGLTGTWVQAKGEKGGENRHMIRRQTQACGAGRRASGRGWRVAGVEGVQVDIVLCRYRRWGAGVTKRCGGNDRYLWGAVTGEGIKRSRKRLR